MLPSQARPTGTEYMGLYTTMKPLTPELTSTNSPDQGGQQMVMGKVYCCSVLAKRVGI